MVCKKRIRVVRAVRGFWKELYDSEFKQFEFVYEKLNTTEKIQKNKKILARLIYMKIFDVLGVYQTIHVDDEDVDMLFSYNRFLRSNKPYILAVENPTAMVHYSAKRTRTFLSKINLKRSFSNKNLKAITCLSRACYDTMRIYYNIPDSVPVYQIYPYVESSLSAEDLNNKINEKVINCLFISSQFELKGGMDLLEAIHRNKWDENEMLEFVIITRLDKLSEKIKNQIEELTNVRLFDFNFTKSELCEFYKRANVFINPTRVDSFSLVTLEALKHGCSFLTTNVYAIKEMVLDNYNGYLTNPLFECWTADNLKNEKIGKKENEIMRSDFVDENIVCFLTEKLNYLLNNRGVLKQFQLNSFKHAGGPFSCEYIKKQWEEVVSNSLNVDK